MLDPGKDLGSTNLAECLRGLQLLSALGARITPQRQSQRGSVEGGGSGEKEWGPAS